MGASIAALSEDVHASLSVWLKEYSPARAGVRRGLVAGSPDELEAESAQVLCGDVGFVVL